MQVPFVLRFYYPEPKNIARDKINRLIHASSLKMAVEMSSVTLQNSRCMYWNCFELLPTVLTLFESVVKKRFGSCIQSIRFWIHPRCRSFVSIIRFWCFCVKKRTPTCFVSYLNNCQRADTRLRGGNIIKSCAKVPRQNESRSDVK